MDNKRIKQLAGVNEMQGVDMNSFMMALQEIEHAMVALQDEAYSMQGEQKQMVLDALKQAGTALMPLKRMNRGMQ